MPMLQKILLFVLLQASGVNALAQIVDDKVPTHAEASTNPEAQASAPTSANSDAVANPEAPAAAPAPAVQPAPSESDQGGTAPPSLSAPHAETDTDFTLFGSQTAAGAGIGCLAGACIPDAMLGLGAVALGVGVGLSLLMGPVGLLFMAVAVVIAMPSLYFGGVCAGPMSAAGAIIGGAVTVAQSERNWCLPIAAGLPGVLLGVAGSTLLVLPFFLSTFPVTTPVASRVSTFSNLIYASIIGGLVAALAAGPVAFAGILVADKFFGGPVDEGWLPDEAPASTSSPDKVKQMSATPHRTSAAY